MEERMTVCNMSIEGGARAGLIAPDETTFAYLKAASRSAGSGLGRGRRTLAQAADRRRRDLRPNDRHRRRQARADGHYGTNPAWAWR